MAEDSPDLLETLKFELKFLEDGGYGRSPRTPWRPTLPLRDSPTCLNFNDAARPHPCSECVWVQFVPQERRKETLPCWFIPLTAMGETVDYYAHCGTQREFEEALAAWLRGTIQRIEGERAGKQGSSAQGDRCDVGGIART